MNGASAQRGTLTQQIGLRAYALLTRLGLWRVPLLRRAFLRLYEFYKDRIEAGPVQGLRQFVPEGSLVVDVGANVGFFTLRFAEWVGSAGRVIAVEPEVENFGALNTRLTQSGLAGRVDTHRAVASSAPGTVRLLRNEVHPGDHRISTDGTGVEIRADTVDRLVAAHGDHDIALVKIDVQGAELLVLEGARETLRKGPALFIEIDAQNLQVFGGSPESVITLLSSFGYTMHELRPDASFRPLREDTLRDMLQRRGYVDVLFLAPTRNPPSRVSPDPAGASL